MDPLKIKIFKVSDSNKCKAQSVAEIWGDTTYMLSFSFHQTKESLSYPHHILI
jgi:hypothetical protein